MKGKCQRRTPDPESDSRKRVPSGRNRPKRNGERAPTRTDLALRPTPPKQCNPSVTPTDTDSIQRSMTREPSAALFQASGHAPSLLLVVVGSYLARERFEAAV